MRMVKTHKINTGMGMDNYLLKYAIMGASMSTLVFTLPHTHKIYIYTIMKKMYAYQLKNTTLLNYYKF